MTIRHGHWTRRGTLGLGLGAVAAPLIGTRAARAQGSGPPAKPKGQIVVGMSQEPTVFNPLMPAIEVDQGVWWNLFSPLWGVDPKGNFQPRLAAEIPTLQNGGISADGLSWKVKLRGDAKWHDGTPFTADDVKFTIDLINTPEFKAARRTGHSLVRDIKVVSPTEITWRMEKPYAPYASILSWTFIVPKHILEKASDPNNAPFNNNPVGTGPFRWSRRVPGDHIELVANEHYFGKGPHVERLVFKYIPDLTMLYTQFRTGDVDFTGLQGITADHYAEAKKLPGRQVHAISQAFIESITLNLGKPQFQDLAVRQALYMGMDKGSIIDAIYYGLPHEAESFLAPQSWAFNPNLPKHVHDAAKAKKILDDAGWKPGSDGVRQKGNVRLSFSNSTTAGNHLREQAQQLLQQDLREIGVDMQIKNMPAAVIWGDYYHMSKFDSVMVGEDFMIGPDPDVTQYFSSHAIPVKTGAGHNTEQYENPKVDELLAAGATTSDRAKRKEIYQQIQAIIRHDLPILPVFQYTLVQGVKDGLMGYAPNVNVQSNCWNIGDWYWTS